MSDENNEIVAEFVIESQEHLADIENELLAIEAGGADVDTDLINKVFRSVHSIKGASGFLGFATIGELSHSLENVLNLMRNQELVPDGGVVDVLLRAADALRGLLNDIDQSNGADVSAHVEALKCIVSEKSGPAVAASVEQTVSVGGPVVRGFEVSESCLRAFRNSGSHLYVLTVDLISDVQEKGKTPLDLVREIVGLGELVESRLETEALGDLEADLPDALPFSVLVATVLEPDMMDGFFGLAADCVCPTTIPGDEASPTPTTPVPEEPTMTEPAQTPPPAPTAETLPPKTEAAPRANDVAKAAKTVESNIRVSVQVLEHLMNLAGELVLGRNQLLQIVGTKDRVGLESVASRVDQVTSELQESIMQTRLQPIGNVFNKFPRIVRDLSNTLGKQCELTIEGKEVELDKTIIEAINDPLTHLIRNSVDHGIETPDVRASRNKPAAGRVVLRAFHQSGKVNIAISDDGAGIDAAKLKEKAVAKGLISADAARDMSEREAVRLIFHPGFSMAAKVTDVSGRGVGMDVVKTDIERLGGTVEIDTELGVGSTVNIKLPLTLAIIPSLIVRTGDERYAIPQVNISELVRVKANDVAKRIQHVKDAEVLRLRDRLLPLVRLSTVLERPSKFSDPQTGEPLANEREAIADRRTRDQEATPSQEQREGADRRRDTLAGALNIIVVESGHLCYGLIVDTLHDSEEIVVKPLGQHMKDCACLAGATILGDGRVALILDIAGIASYRELAMPEATEDDAAAQGDDNNDTQAILLFTNDPSEAFGVPMSLISRIERVRADQIDSVGGRAVLQYRGTSLPLLSMEDYIQALPRPEQPQVYVVVFNITGREIGLIAPTLVDIRRMYTDVDTVTFRQPGVLGSAVIDDKTTRLIDIYELVETAHPEWIVKGQAVEVDEGQAAAILFAEDSDFFRKQVVSYLTGAGYEVVACEDGQIAWNALQDPEQPINLVVTDIEMPNMNGLELTQRIKSDPCFAHLPVIAVTSLASDEDLERGRQVGVDEYHVKMDRERLLDAVAAQLKRVNATTGAAAPQPAVAARS